MRFQKTTCTLFESTWINDMVKAEQKHDDVASVVETSFFDVIFPNTTALKSATWVQKLKKGLVQQMKRTPVILSILPLDSRVVKRHAMTEVVLTDMTKIHKPLTLKTTTTLPRKRGKQQIRSER